MRITVRFFAIFKDRCGVGQSTLELPAETTVSAAVKALAGRYPQIHQLLQRAAFAVNQTYVSGDCVLRDGDELALIPPVSGGSERFEPANRGAD